MKIYISLLFFFLSFSVFGQNTDYYKSRIDSVKKGQKTDDLIPYFQKELETYPTNEVILTSIGYLYNRQQQADSVQKYYEKALSINSKCVECYHYLGMVQAVNTNYTKALEYLNKGIEIAPYDGKLHILRAEIKMYSGDRFGSLSDFNRAIELEPYNSNFYLARSKYNLQQNYDLLALSDLDKAIELDSTNATAYFQRASIQHSKQSFEKCLSDMNKAIELDSTKEDFYFGRGVVLSVLKQHQKAIDDYTKVIQSSSENYLAYHYRALDKYALEDMKASFEDLNLAYTLIKKYDDQSYVKQAIEHSIENYCNSNKVSYYYQRGIAFYNLQKIDEAIEIYNVGKKKFPTNSMLLAFSGNAYMIAQKYQKAILDYNSALKYKSNFIEDVKVNQQHTGMKEEEISVYIDGHFASVYLNLAEAKFALGNYQEAIIEINKGIQLAPNLKEFGKETYYYTRGAILLGLGKYAEAEKDFSTAIELNSDFALAYTHRAITKISISNKTNLNLYSIQVTGVNQLFQPKWDFLIKNNLDKSDVSISSALEDCDKAISINPSLNLAYYVRGQIKKAVQDEDYCNDLLKAKELGYEVDCEK